MDVAGVYVREEGADITIGKLVGPVSATGEHIPRTDRRQATKKLVRGNMHPAEFLKNCAEWIKTNTDDLGSVAVACFGPFRSLDESGVDVVERNKDYGKLSDVLGYKDWAEMPIYQIFYETLHDHMRPDQMIRIYTDVDAAAYGEYWYRAKDQRNVPKYLQDSSLVFLNFSKSINGGIAHDGQLWRGRLHPLMSVIRPARYSIVDEDGSLLMDEYEGTCPYHRDCVEGLIGINALQERTGALKFDEIPDSHEVWEVFAYYAAQLCIAVTGVLAPSRIVLGGRAIKEQTDYVFAQEITRKIRNHFYYQISNGRNQLSPNYKELLDVDEFISLPRRPARRDGRIRASRPGVHGALRIAANNAIKVPE